MQWKTWIAALGLLAAGAAGAQDYPAKPVTLVIPFAGGGPTDLVGRALAKAMAKSLRQPVNVENTGGAGGTFGAGRVAKAAPDGYTILLHHIGHATAQALYPKLAYDPAGDFEPVGLAVNVPMTLIGRPNLAAANLQQLVALMKHEKGQLKLGNGGIGSASHLCGLLLLSRLEAESQTVPFKGTGPALKALQAGQLDVMCDQTTNTVDEIRADKVKVYGVTTRKRLAALPNVPTMAEDGLAGFEVIVWHGLYAPRATPKSVVEQLAGALQAGLKDAEFKAQMKELGADIVASDSAKPEALRLFLKAEIDKWGPLVKKAGVYAE